RGKARAAFCAVRPPGHHAGPSGGVGSDRDPVATTGFCLINNVAVAAAYALSVHRELVRKVAILDFDVHHGNGTEACVGATVPGLRTVPFATPFSEGVQGFGVEEGPDTVFYPGSGGTSDSLDLVDRAGAGSAGPGDERSAAPRVIDVGIPGGRPHVALWRRSWRDKILPELVSFDPDLILISAGFDAHRKDVMNHCHIGVTERDYEWLTEHIMQVANRCKSHVVSILEGGYRVQGGFASALARSVAAHVQVLAHPSRKCWNEEDGQKERDLEAAQRAEAAKKRAEAEAALAAQEAALEAGGEAEAGDRKRRRRGGGAVDYLALNAKLDAENKAQTS
ncbi:histone deacetylase, partial [Helicosporidium sp. ATCC 50920]